MDEEKRRDAELDLKARNEFHNALRRLQVSNRPEKWDKMSKLPKNGKLVLEKWVAKNYHHPCKFI